MINTAIEYLKRFFLKQTFYDFDGLDMMYTAIYLAIKIEEVNYTLSMFVEMNKQCKVESIVRNEAFLIKGLKFQFFVYSPYRFYNALIELLKEAEKDLKIEDFEKVVANFETLGKKIIRITHLYDFSFLYSASIISFCVFRYLFKNLLNQELLHNEAMVETMKSKEFFKKSFWERGDSQTMEQIIVEKVYFSINHLFDDNSVSGENIFDRVQNKKTPDISSIKTYKKYIKVVHMKLPNYLKDKEKDRKKKEVIPVDFMSDDELKEQEPVDGFKPPKPMKPGKRSISGPKPKEGAPSASVEKPAPPTADATMAPEDKSKELEDMPDDMEISIPI